MPLPLWCKVAVLHFPGAPSIVLAQTHFPQRAVLAVPFIRGILSRSVQGSFSGLFSLFIGSENIEIFSPQLYRMLLRLVRRRSLLSARPDRWSLFLVDDCFLFVCHRNIDLLCHGMKKAGYNGPAGVGGIASLQYVIMKKRRP